MAKMNWSKVSRAGNMARYGSQQITGVEPSPAAKLAKNRRKRAAAKARKLAHKRKLGAAAVTFHASCKGAPVADFIYRKGEHVVAAGYRGKVANSNALTTAIVISGGKKVIVGTYLVNFDGPSLTGAATIRRPRTESTAP